MPTTHPTAPQDQTTTLTAGLTTMLESSVAGGPGLSGSADRQTDRQTDPGSRGPLTVVTENQDCIMFSSFLCCVCNVFIFHLFSLWNNLSRRKNAFIYVPNWEGAPLCVLVGLIQTRSVRPTWAHLHRVSERSQPPVKIEGNNFK